MQVALTQTEADSPEGLLSRIAMGDKSAESYLVKNYYRGLLFVISRQTRNTDLAQDIAQDTFVVVLDKARKGEINHPDALSAFIRQTGLNLLIGHFRKETRRDTHGIEDISIHPIENDIDVCRALYSKQILQITKQMINEMKVERDRELLRDYFEYDKTKEHICLELDMKPEHFDRVLFRARQRLKDIIQHKFGKTISIDGQGLLSVLILIGFLNTPQSSPNFFNTYVRETSSDQHLLYETPKTSSRYLLSLDQAGKQLTTNSRCV